MVHTPLEASMRLLAPQSGLPSWMCSCITSPAFDGGNARNYRARRAAVAGHFS
jgi:hypothetical protein